MSESRNARNRPRVPARPPSDRHYLNRIGRSTVVKNRNTLILPGIDVQADVRAINEGQAERRGMFFVINGRVYGQEPSGRLFPDHGDGFIFLDRPAMQALKILARYNGPTPQAEFQFSMDPNITPTVVEIALAAWRRRKKT